MKQADKQLEVVREIDGGLETIKVNNDNFKNLTGYLQQLIE